MSTQNPAIKKSSSGILSGVYPYTYVLNNSLKYTDPSGYTKVARDYAGESMYMFMQNMTGRVMEMSYGLASFGGGGFSTNSGLYYDGVGNFYENGEWVPTSYVVDWYLKPNADFSTSDPTLINLVYAINTNTSNYNFTLYTGQGKYGSGHLLIEDLENNTSKVQNVPFWELTGSYFNELYYFDGLIAYNLNNAVKYGSTSYNPNFGGIANATLLMAGGVAEMAVGGIVEFFSAGTSTPLTVPLIIDGATRTVANAQRLSMYLKGNNKTANTYPTNAGAVIGKAFDLIDGVPIEQVGPGQRFYGTSNDILGFIITGGSGRAIESLVTNPTWSNGINYGFTYIAYPTSLYNDLKPYP